MTEIYPLTIVADRYGGTYSDAGFTAWNLNHDEVPKDISSDDVSCNNFWVDNKIIVGKGATPELAVKDLEQKLFDANKDVFINTFNSLHDIKISRDEIKVGDKYIIVLNNGEPLRRDVYTMVGFQDDGNLLAINSYIESCGTNINLSYKLNATEKCETCNGKGEELHVCPYKEDIHGDSTTLCNCCESCTHNCAMDI